MILYIFIYILLFQDQSNWGHATVSDILCIYTSVGMASKPTQIFLRISGYVVSSIL